MTSCDESDAIITEYKSVSPSQESSTTTAALPEEPEDEYIPFYDANDVLLKWVRWKDAKVYSLGNAGALKQADREAFKAAYEDAKAVEGKIVKHFFWFEVREAVVPEGWAYCVIPFSVKGENLEIYVNGHPMDVVSLGGNRYEAHISEFGAISVLCD